MAVTKDAIKLMASQSLTDQDDGGGMMSGIEIVSGNVNNLFPDTSRLDRVLGRCSIRKAFAAVMTDDNDTYYGNHIILTDPPDDPRVSVSIFSTQDHFDTRTKAQDRIESYVVQGPKYPGYLLTNQLEGARTIQIVQREETAIPRVGEVFYLVENEGLVTEISQYVRITEVSAEMRTFTVLSGSAYVSIRRRVVTCEIGDALRETFHGTDANITDSSGAAKLYSTYVADASKYYGVKKLSQAIESGSLSLKIESIFNNLVPSAQAESPVIDITAGGAVKGIKKSGSSISFNTSLTLSVGTKIYCGTGISRGSLKIVNGGSTWIDDQKGGLVRAGVQEGTVEYGSGEVMFQISGISGTFAVSYIPAVQTSGINRTYGMDVTLASRSYNYTFTLSPPPEPGTLIVDYMSQGNWYRLQENGAGDILPLISGTGSGTYNSETGSGIITCGALPDVDTTILLAWSANVEFKEAESTVINDAFKHVFTLPQSPIEPGSVGFSFDGVLVSDNGSGGLQGVGGTIDYISGEIVIIPDFLKPSAGVDLSINPNYRAPGEEAHLKSGAVSILAGPANSFANIGATKANTLVITGLKYDMDGVQMTVDAKDSGGTLKVVSAVTVVRGNETFRIEKGITVGTFAPGNGDLLIYGSLIGKVWGADPIYSQIDGGLVYSGVHSWFGDKDATAISGQVSYSGYEGSAVFSDVSGSVNKNSTRATLSGFVNGDILSDAVSINIGANNVIIKNGVLYKEYNNASGTGTIIGSLSPDGGIILSAPFVTDVPNTIVIKSLVTKISNQYVIDATFRTPGAPVRPGSFYVQAKRMSDGVMINATADLTGVISSSEIKGKINHETGVVSLRFGKIVSPASDYINEPWYSADLVENDSIWMPIPVIADTIKYNGVVYTYIPLDASLIGLDPVRLPQDGRVPIFRKGDVIVVHHTLQATLPSGLVAGQQISLPRGDLTHVEIYDAGGVYVPETKYTANLVTGVITMADPLDLSGFVQPLVAQHRREEMKLCSDVQINGSLTCISPFIYDYPAGETMVSGALLFGDLQSRVWNIFDQKTWGNVWSDNRIGDAATATYNTLNYPIVTTNKGAIPQKWALVFYSTTQFYIMGEQVGVIGEGNINQDCAPINPATNAPYFRVKLEGWGAGWVSGNALRFNTDAAAAPIWFVRTTLQGPVTEADDEFVCQIRGDGD